MKRARNLLCYSGVLGLALSVCLTGANFAAAAETGAVSYLKCNIHYQQQSRDARASYANWTDPKEGHMILPVNTQVEIGRFRGGFSIVALPTKKEIYFEYDEGRMRMTQEQYLAIITSPTPVQLDAFSELDRKGILDGKAYVGMSKSGVMAALGYPAAHRTPSPDGNTWVYWKDRFRNFSVQFDDKGLVTGVGR